MLPHVKAALKDLRAGLERMYGPRLLKIVLFGSQARGDARPDSDIDVIAVLDGEVKDRVERAHCSEMIAAICLEHTVVISCFFKSLEKFEHSEESTMHFVRTEGVAV